MDAAALVRPIVEQGGLELLEVSFHREAGRQILRVTVDREGGIDLDTLSEMSERVSRRLDLEDFGRGRYELEVSSPGIERALLTPRHFARFVGSQVKIKTAVPIEGVRSHRGTLVSATQESIVVDAGGAVREIALGDIETARTVADWDAELHRSTA